ncbi:hypothetical protein [Stutzerimonas nitrititolerans]|uniref:hypothetical protein n=1 Tax=Stutzerimonas nitrititolerans TaxID=2482751 RepID=UPI00289884CA|nr:hypothetical protein [Stutzerimonas nitrititolerans]
MVEQTESARKAGVSFSGERVEQAPARPQLREDGRGREARLGNTTIFTAKPGGGSGDKPLKNQQVKEVIDPETGEIFRYTYCEKRQDWVKDWDRDEALMERWLLQRYAKQYLSRPEFWEDREKAVYAPYTDLTAKVKYCDIETRKVVSVLAHKIGQPVVKQKRHFIEGSKFSDLETRRQSSTKAVNRAPMFRVVTCFGSKLPQKSAELHQNVESGSVCWHNVAVCGSVWTCPVCSAKINRARRDEISRAYEAVAQDEGCAYMLTFTVKHGLGDDLGDLLGKVKDAFQHLQKSPAFKEVTRKKALVRPQADSLPFLGYIGRIANLEVTYGERNGWHPHEHHLWFFRRELTASEVMKVRDRLFDAWKSACLAVGLPAPKKFGKNPDGSRRCVALDVRKAMSAQEYLTKFGQFDSDGALRERRWGPEKELAGAHVKKATGKGATPFQLLYQAAQGCNHSRERFVEFAQAFKGRHQLQFSRSLKAYLAELEEAVIVDDSEEGDQVLASALDGDSVLLLELSDQQFDKVVRNRVQGALLVIARNQGAAAVLEFIGQLPDNPPDDFSG